MRTMKKTKKIENNKKTNRTGIWTNRDLHHCYNLFRSRYFGNRIPPATGLVFLRFGTLHKGLGRTAVFRSHTPNPRIYGITIDREIRWSRRLWAMTLLHEMVHVEQRCEFSCSINGHRFNRRMKQLSQLGAMNGIW